MFLPARVSVWVFVSASVCVSGDYARKRRSVPRIISSSPAEGGAQPGGVVGQVRADAN